MASRTDRWQALSPAAGFWLLCAVIVGCQETAAPTRFLIEARAVDEAGVGVADVAVSLGSRALGSTNHLGLMRAEIPGADGKHATLRFKVPTNSRALTDTEIPVVFQVVQGLHAETPEPQPIQGQVIVAPLTRTYVVLVHTNKPSLPIRFFDREQGRTNAAGVAQLLFEAPPGDELAVTLDTSAMPQLQPTNPMRIFKLADTQEVFVFRQEFKQDRKRFKGTRRTVNRATRGPRRL